MLGIKLRMKPQFCLAQYISVRRCDIRVGNDFMTILCQGQDRHIYAKIHPLVIVGWLSSVLEIQKRCPWLDLAGDDERDLFLKRADVNIGDPGISANVMSVADA